VNTVAFKNAWLLGLTFLLAANMAVGSDVVIDLALVESEVMPLEQILVKERLKQKGRILEAEILQRGPNLVYDIVVLQKNGVVREYNFDARTGRFLGERKGD